MDKFKPIRIDVLDHGFVELIDMMGDDLEPARAARMSYSDGKTRPIADELKLSKYLLDNHHTTPFEMVELKWRMKMPIFVARQIVRHRTANINEFSMRYADPERISEGEDIDYYTPSEWRSKDPKNKQGSLVLGELGGLVDHYDKPLNDLYHDAIEDAISTYHAMQQHGVANELARMVLPVSVYTEWIWKNDLHNTLHFLDLRSWLIDDHAQWETQEFAKAMIQLLDEVLPELMRLWRVSIRVAQ